uniref:RNA helicase n=1 Tax=Sinocyclocheilus rhinocerous TaxID=307959 RepID=A0A673GTM9_9TELE
MDKSHERMLQPCIPRSLIIIFVVFLQKKKKKLKEQQLMAGECDSPAPRKRKTARKSFIFILEHMSFTQISAQLKKKKKANVEDVMSGGEPDKPSPSAVVDSDSDREKVCTRLAETPEQKEGAFSNFRISQNTIKLLQARGVSYLFDIQVKTFNSVYDGKDVIGQARTGTGKTFSFAVPLVEKLQAAADDRRRGRAPTVLVLTPTRELAIQVSKDFKDVTKKLSVTCFYGGSSYNPQLEAIRNGIDVLVGTPGRIRDHLQNNKLDLSQIKHVVLDEVDQMLDMGFAEQVEEILSVSYKKDAEEKPQTLLFSATCPAWVYEVAKKYMRSQYIHVDLIGKKTQKAATTVEHLAIACHWSQRASVIGDVVQVYSGSHGRTIVFCETKREATELSMNTSIKQSAQTLHGDIPQKQREITLKGFRSGTFEVLVATNVAARGLDIPELDLVIQCSPPNDVESYIHRSGRTGRAGRTGICICFYQRKEESQLKFVEQKAGITFKRVGVPTANDIIQSSSKDAVRFLDSVPAVAVGYFREAAQELIEQRGAVEALAAALAHISGATSLEQRSLINSDTVRTCLYTRPADRERLLCSQVSVADACLCLLTRRVSVSLQDRWQDGRRWQLSVATELPEMEQSMRPSSERSSGGFGRGRRSFGFKGNNSSGGRRGRGGAQKRSFSQAFDY